MKTKYLDNKYVDYKDYFSENVFLERQVDIQKDRQIYIQKDRQIFIQKDRQISIYKCKCIDICLEKGNVVYFAENKSIFHLNVEKFNREKTTQKKYFYHQIF